MSDDNLSDLSDLSDLSSLSSLSPAPTDDETDVQLRSEKGILKFFHKVPKPKTTIKLTNKAKAAGAAAASKSRSKKTSKQSKLVKLGKSGKSKKAAAKDGDAEDGNNEDSDGDASPPKRERAPSPPHEYVLADNQDIAVSDATAPLQTLPTGRYLTLSVHRHVPQPLRRGLPQELDQLRPAGTRARYRRQRPERARRVLPVCPAEAAAQPTAGRKVRCSLAGCGHPPRLSPSN